MSNIALLASRNTCQTCREEEIYSTPCHLLALALQFRAQSQISLGKSLGLVLYCGLKLSPNHGGMISRSTRCTAGCSARPVSFSETDSSIPNTLITLAEMTESLSWETLPILSCLFLNDKNHKQEQFNYHLN